jgi:large subunit ribosomal protein L22
VPGLKTNERPGTRAVVRHSHLSAFKAREVLDLIRGVEYGRAIEILEHSDRGAAEVIGKLLHSAASNAQHNEGLEPEEMYVSACFADEGTTMKRWRPRARGRATRIRKRTCHITVILSRMPDEEIARRRARVAAEQMERRQRRVAGTRRARRQQADVRAEVAAEEAAEAELLAAAEEAAMAEAAEHELEGGADESSASATGEETVEEGGADESSASATGEETVASSDDTPADTSTPDAEDEATDESADTAGVADEGATDQSAEEGSAADEAGVSAGEDATESERATKTAEAADFSGADEEENE